MHTKVLKPKRNQNAKTCIQTRSYKTRYITQQIISIISFLHSANFIQVHMSKLCIYIIQIH